KVAAGSGQKADTIFSLIRPTVWPIAESKFLKDFFPGPPISSLRPFCARQWGGRISAQYEWSCDPKWWPKSPSRPRLVPSWWRRCAAIDLDLIPCFRTKLGMISEERKVKRHVEGKRPVVAV